ncbi:hypothetical protein BASA61_007926 [Batrachochytrium salamandrivorans]|nr:hypothetical protein BASA61_007926 [Batrachochytrium salamandrivorans]
MSAMVPFSAEAITDSTIKLLSTTLGRDKLNRFVQFFSRFLISYSSDLCISKDTVSRLTVLMTQISNARKLMNAGRQIEFLRNAQKALSLPDETIRLATFSKCICLSIWLSFDFLLWIHAVGLAKFSSIKDIGRRSNKFWLASIVASLMGTVYKIRDVNNRLVQERKLYMAVVSQKIKDDSADSVGKSMAKLRSEQKSLLISAVQDCVDMTIPLSGLEYITIHSGLVGLAGALTSLTGACMCIN